VVTDLDRDDAPPGRAASRAGGALRTLGKYRFIASLGHGGMAEVFLAVAMGPAGFNKLQVIKRLRPNLADDPELCAMFLDEARLAARLNHKNVVQTNEVDRIDGQYFMAMEYLDGQPLHRVLGRARQLGRRVPMAAIARITAEALEGLQYAHDLCDYDGEPLSIVHRDVSPQNVFVTYDGQVKIVDFGIAKAARRAVDTDTGVIKGKLAYMAPEQAFSPSDEIDRRADVFSVGVMLWEMLAERRLWHDLGDPQILAALVRDPPRLDSVQPDVAPALSRLCERALAHDREHRHASAAALRAEVLRVAQPCAAEELGGFVEALFGQERAEIKARIARQVDVVTGDEAADLLDLDRGSLPRRSQWPAPIPPPSPPRAVPAGPVSETPPPSTVTARRAPVAAPAETSGPHRTLFAEHHRPQSRAPLVGGALLVAAAAAFYLATAGGREAPRPAASASASASASAAPVEATAPPAGPAPAGTYVHLHLAANPLEARIVVDGAPLPSNPFDGKFLKDGAVHRVQFEAAGFLPQSRVLVFDKDQALDVPLQPRPRVDPGGMKPDPYR
jgi:serine/threonine-protein kinase